jgi:hypothetical protein
MGRVKAETINLKGNSYELVKSRIKRLHAQFPGATVQTEILDRRFNEGGYLASVVIQATITVPVEQGSGNELPKVSQGMSMAERSRGGQVGFLEKCETAAIGRALASLGFISDGTGFASADEMTKLDEHETRVQKEDW